MIYYCNIGGCSQQCECSDCQMGATKDNNTRCKKHIPDHPDNSDEEKYIKYHRKIFTVEEVQKEFLVMKLPKMEKTVRYARKMSLSIDSITEPIIFSAMPVTT